MFTIFFYEETTGTRSENYTIYDPSNDYWVISATLTKELGQPDNLVFEMPSIHENYDRINKNCTVCIWNPTEGEPYNRRLMFMGRPSEITIDFNNTKKVTCEGCLAYLCDIYHEPFTYKTASGATEPNAFLRTIINWYNRDCYVPTRQFVLGDVSVSDPNNYISRSSDEPMRIIDILSEKCINDTLGGYFVARPYYMGDLIYLDYVTGPEKEADQTIEFGVNLLDVAQSVEYTDFCTMLLPLGHSETVTDSSGNQTKEYVTIESVNPHKSESEWSSYSNIRKMCLSNNGLVYTYGAIMQEVVWDDVTEPSNLLTKAQAYMETLSPSVVSLTVNAIDLAITDEELEGLSVGDMVHVHSEKHGIEQNIGIFELEYDLLSPENNVITLGSTTEGIAENSISTSRQMSTSESAIYKQIDAMAVDYIVATGTTDGSWTYRKWNSGLLEAWKITDFTTAVSTARGSMYYVQLDQALDIGLKSWKTIQIQPYRANGSVFATIYTVASTKLTFDVTSATQLSSGTVRIEFYVAGTWK